MQDPPAHLFPPPLVHRQPLRGVDCPVCQTQRNDSFRREARGPAQARRASANPGGDCPVCPTRMRTRAPPRAHNRTHTHTPHLPHRLRCRHTACAAEGLGYLHRLGLAHGNLRPTTMLVRDVCVRERVSLRVCARARTCACVHPRTRACDCVSVCM